MKKLLSHKSILIISIAVICCNLVLLLFFSNSDARAASKIRVVYIKDEVATRSTFKEYRKAYRKLGCRIDNNIFKSLESYKEDFWCKTGSEDLIRRLEFPNGYTVYICYENPQQDEWEVYYAVDDENFQMISIEDINSKLLEVMSYEKKIK